MDSAEQAGLCERRTRKVKGAVPIGRKGNYEEWLTDDGLLQIQNWAREGLTNEQIAHNVGVSGRSFAEWVSRFPSLSSALKKGKAPVDIEVENALLKRALGYDYEETVTEIHKDGNGVERQHIRKIKKHMPADTTAQIFWLKNRRPDRWRDKVVDTSGEDKNAPIFDLLRRLDNECGIQ